MCFTQALEPYRELGDSPGYFKHDHNTCYDFALTELPTVLCLFAAMLSTHPAAVFLSFFLFLLLTHSVHATNWVVASGILLAKLRLDAVLSREEE